MENNIKIDENKKYLEIAINTKLFSAADIARALNGLIDKCSVIFDGVPSQEVSIRLVPRESINLKELSREINLKLNIPTNNYHKRLGEASRRSFIIVTRRCVNDCLFCTEAEKRQWAEPTIEELKGFLDSECRSFPSIVFSGGEPTLRKEIFELIEYAKDRGYYVRLFSNGRLFADDEIARKAAKAGLDAVLIPLHGPTPAIHDRITQRPGSFEQAIAGMKNLVLYNIDVQIKIIPNKINYQYLPELASLAVSLPGNFVCLDMLVISGNALKHLNIIATKLSDMAPYIEKALDVLITGGKKVEVVSLPLCLISKRYWPYLHNARVKDEINIGADQREMSFITTPGEILAPICRKCSVRNKCSGMWAPYFKIYGDAELKPIG